MTGPLRRVLTIEDDEMVGTEISIALRAHGFLVECVLDGETGLKRARQNCYVAVTLDRMLPDMDGLEVIGELRRLGNPVPVLMVSALSDVDERVRGLRAGGDDYLTKPFEPEELAARIDALLRARDAAAMSATILRYGVLSLDMLARTASAQGYTIELKPSEFRLLEYFIRNAGLLLTRGLILEHVWGYRFDPGTNVIDVHVARLRQTLEIAGVDGLLQTVRGKGYRFGDVE